MLVEGGYREVPISYLYTVASGATMTPHIFASSNRATIKVKPAGTATVEGMIAAGGEWEAMASIDPNSKLAGTLSALAVDVAVGPLYAFRVTAAAGAAKVEVCQ